MPANPHRRIAISDSAIRILGARGARALTHRAVDRDAGLPLGTCANFAPSRSDLLLAAAERTFERLAPDPARIAAVDGAGGDARETLTTFVQDVLERLLADPDLARCLIEVRLEASRSEAVRDLVTPVLRGGFETDAAFHEARGLPGGRRSVALLHHLVNGLVLDRLTVSIDPDADPRAVARDAVRRLAGRD